MVVHILITNNYKNISNQMKLSINNIIPLGLHNPLDALYHLQPFMTLTLIPLAFYIEGEFFSVINVMRV